MITEAHLAGKVAIVTGSSRGIGAGIAFELARKGANVMTFLRISKLPPGLMLAR